MFELFDKLFLKIKVLPLFSRVPLSFYRFFITGLITFTIDTISLNLLFFILFEGADYKLFDTLSLPKFISASIAILFGFFINQNWSFKSNKGRLHKQLPKYVLTFVFNLFVASTIFPIYRENLSFLDADELSPTIANILTTATIMFISYTSYRYFVFNGEPKHRKP